MCAHWGGYCCCSQDLGFGSHGRGGAGRRGLPMGLEGRLGHGLVSAVWLDARAGYSRWVCGDSLSTGPTAQYGSDAGTEVLLPRDAVRLLPLVEDESKRASQAACERTASYGGARTGLRRFALGLFGRPPRARAGLLAEDLPLLLQATSSLTTIPPSQNIFIFLYSRAVRRDFSFTLSTQPSTAL